MSKLKLYTVDMKYIRNLHNVDDKVPSVSPQIGKDERPFVGVVAMINGRKYCIPLTKPKDKHKTMRGSRFFLGPFSLVSFVEEWIIYNHEKINRKVYFNII